MLIVGLAFVVPSFAPYRKPMPIVAFLLGISSGFPLTLLLGTMTFWLSKVGIDKSTIGFAIGLTTPYTLKFLWAPQVDRLQIPVLTRQFGQRRRGLFVIKALRVDAIWQLVARNTHNEHHGTIPVWEMLFAIAWRSGRVGERVVGI